MNKSIQLFFNPNYIVKSIAQCNTSCQKYISETMIVVGSCLENLYDITLLNEWAANIFKEHNCSMENALSTIKQHKKYINLIVIENKYNISKAYEIPVLFIDKPTQSFLKHYKMGNIVVGTESIFSLVNMNLLYFLFVLFLSILFSKKIILNIQQFILYKRKLKRLEIKYTNQYNFNQCTICIENFNENEKIIKLNCDHLFHKQCIQTWIKQKEMCPNCNHPLSNVSETSPLLQSV